MLPLLALSGFFLILLNACACAVYVSYCAVDMLRDLLALFSFEVPLLL